MIVNWQPSPIRTPPGILKTRAKSAALSVVPIANMMICKTGMKRTVISRSPSPKNHEGKVMNDP